MQDERWLRLVAESRANQARVLAEPRARIPWLALLGLSPLFLICAGMWFGEPLYETLDLVWRAFDRVL